MRVFHDILRALQANDVRYVLVGGVAVVLHGFARFTKDLDLVVDLQPDEARRAIQTLLDCGLRPRVPVNAFDFADAQKRQEWLEQKNMLVFQMVDERDLRRNVDLFISYPIEFERLWDSSDIIDLEGVAVRVSSIDDLIEIKKSVARPQDLIDVEQLERLKNADEH
jgi:predicted nucleotidyltransferase